MALKPKGLDIKAYESRAKSRQVVRSPADTRSSQPSAAISRAGYRRISSSITRTRAVYQARKK
jgi:hypothetical protein